MILPKDEVLKLLVSVCDPDKVSPIEKNGVFVVVTQEELLAFAQAIAKKARDEQRELDAQECERMTMYRGGRCEAPAHNTVWDAANAIRATKE